MRNPELIQQARALSEIDELDGESQEGSSPFDSTTSSSKSIRSNGEDSVQPLAMKESRRIFWVRVILALVLIAATVATSYVIYKATKDGEDEQFVTSFHDSAIKLMDEFEASLRTTIAAIDNFAIVSATQQQSNEKIWPFVVNPKFEIGGSSTRHLAGANMLSVIPLVSSNNRAAWEAFAANNSAWVQEGQAFDSWTPHDSSTDGSHNHMRRRQRQLEGHEEVPVEFENDIATTIFRISEQDHSAIVDIDRPYYLPVWQSTPVQPQLVNYDLFSHGSFGQAGALVINTSSVVFGLVADVSDIHDPFNFLYHVEEHHGYEFGDIHADGHDDHEEEEEEEQGHEEEGHEEEGHEEDGHEEEGHEEDRHLEEGHEEDGHQEEEEGHDDHDEDDHDGEEEEEEEAHTGKVGADAHQHEDGEHADDFGDPLSMTYFPIFDHIEEPRNVVGLVSVVIYWRDFLLNVLPPNAQPVLAVLENGCGQQFSYVVIGEDVLVAGEGDFHESKYGHMEETFYIENLADAEDLTFSGVPLNVEYCPYHLRVFPTSEMEDHYHTNKPGAYAGGVVAVFLFAMLIFLLYDFLVTRRQHIVAQKARETMAVVNSLFPARVRDRLFQKGESQKKLGKDKKNNKDAFLTNATPTGMGISGGAITSSQISKSIADLFPDATVLFADICGFTAWSSSREPCQVFALLETVYGKFDAIARKEAVFKVETIGDCYVAVTGVPEPQSDHATRMARFAQKCLEKLNQLTKILEVSLGPDTANLAMRFGLHSGPVTAGVLRGERARFQLFGDTVNTASRMESTGVPNRIHCSKATADLLSEEWVTKRDELVEAKGKGQIQTYWIVPRSFSSTETSSQKGSNESVTAGGAGHTFRVEKTGDVIDSKIDRMVDWNVDLLLRLLQEVVASRKNDMGIERAAYIPRKETNNPIAEITDTFLVSRHKRSEQKPSPVDLGPDVLAQLRDYIASIAYMYKDNPFHNFDHASHVTMSAQKLLNRAITNWQTSDPLTHFAVIFSTVIHDVDHRGLPNFLLAKEDYDMASQYNEKSIAEQNSIDVAWELLMEGAYEDLRRCIFTNEDEYRQFRSQVVNIVLATDIFDKDLKALRNKRWETAFENSNGDDEHCLLKGSIVLEHLIQASDVSHTMQHWHVFLKWNQKLFNEMYKAFENGRGKTDPSQGWYKGELWFFDNYVIPLARRLKDCGVFGVSSDEYLNYAEQNRREWESKGESIVAQWVAAKPAIQPVEVISANSQVEVTTMRELDTHSDGGEAFC